MREITYVDPGSLGRIFGLISLAITSLLLIPVMFVMIRAMWVQGAFSWEFLKGFAFLLLYPALGYIFGTLFAVMYNFIAPRVGGIEFDTQ